MQNHKTQQFAKFFLKDLKVKVLENNSRESKVNNLKFSSAS